jgi:hypothetical protein
MNMDNENLNDVIELWYPSKRSLWKYFKTFFPLPIDKPYIKLSYLVPEKFAHSEGTVIDFESTQVPEYPQAKVITAGFFHNRKIEIYQCHIPWQTGKFQSIVQSLVLNRPMPLIAYSAEFEVRFSGYGKPPRYYGDYKVKVWEESIWKDILQYGLGESYYTDEVYLYRKKLINCIKSPSNDFLGRYVPKLWARWSSSFDQRSLFEIIYHNTLDLHRESYVAQNLSEVIEKKRDELIDRDDVDWEFIYKNVPKIIFG